MASVDILTIEVGSTITKVNGFRRADGRLEHVAQGFAPTSVAQGDVGIGVDAAIADLEQAYGGSVAGVTTYVNSSAAGGLRMTVHGLTVSMTARAAREASLGAGAIVQQVTAGALDEDDVEDVRELAPNIILLAGGVDHGEKKVVVDNARALAPVAAELGVPVIYAGNSAARRGVTRAFDEHGVELLLADNVFPAVDVLDVEPLRVLIHEVFNRHITRAAGMGRFAEITDRGILPTPGAVLRGAELFAAELGDVLVVDVGGATTDIHSVTEGSLEYAGKVLDPEPRAKRTVEGDLGVYVNARNVVEAYGDETWAARLDDLEAMPATDRQRELTRWLCATAVQVGVRRHAGSLTDIYTPTGKKQVVRGKDLTAVRWVVATGGALTRVEGSAEVLRSVCTGPGAHLLPESTARVLVDRDYLFSALGTIGEELPDEVRATFRAWVEQADPEGAAASRHTAETDVDAEDADRTAEEQA
ncbi:glutamate mutase L [Arsenicicoccus dermatophilus]|uniref:glutamate mutase L n=1 Tax=Arsenicicoccus dermatophilus TaxID=1076331 RepID=UPI001F4C5674|nr:glutamate mutase L [Arsenicicoccus dermatophilus]MCH8613726.1 glutamate mutase L [Arsenicicoccus dermatophilus]